MLESVYQRKLILELDRRFPGCVVLKNDTDFRQGMPDLLLLWRDRWAMLEVKPRRPMSSDDFEPNQEWYLAKFDEMSFGACIYPENEMEVLDDLQQAFGIRRTARVS